MEKYEENLVRAEKAIETADHMVYITYPLIKEKKLLLRALSELHEALIAIINSILQYEYYYKRINLYSNPRDNFETFRQISLSYKVSEDQLSRIVEIFKLAERHKKSPFEFVKEDNIIIMSNGMRTDVLGLDKIKLFLIEVKDIIKKAKDVIRKRI